MAVEFKGLELVEIKRNLVLETYAVPKCVDSKGKRIPVTVAYSKLDGKTGWVIMNPYGINNVYGEPKENNPLGFEQYTLVKRSFSEVCEYLEIPERALDWTIKTPEYIGRVGLVDKEDAKEDTEEIVEGAKEVAKEDTKEDAKEYDKAVEEFDLEELNPAMAVKLTNKSIKTLANAVAESVIDKINEAKLAEELAKAEAEAEESKEETEEEPVVETEEPVGEVFTEDDFNKNVYGQDAKKLNTLLKIKGALLLVSPPGRGKTTTARNLANFIIGHTNSKRVKMVSFNATTSYADVIGGIKIGDDGNWHTEKGSLMSLAEDACNNPDDDYIYIIDEINRGNTEAVIGEMITAMEQRGIPVLTNIGEQLVVPKNLYIIATMNSYDSSTKELDAATLDRFAIYEMEVPKDVSAATFHKEDVNEELKEYIMLVYNTITSINKKLETDAFKGKENEIGLRALYTDYSNIEELKYVVKYDIKPKVMDRLSNLSDSDRKEVEELLEELLDKLDKGIKRKTED